jgi:hypothetical protein
MIAQKSMHCIVQMFSSGKMMFFYMHNGEHGLPIVANMWHKTGLNWFEGKGDNVNHANGDNNGNVSEYNKAKALVNDFNFSDNEEGNSREEDDKEDDCEDIPLLDMEIYDDDEEDRVEGFV